MGEKLSVTQVDVSIGRVEYVSIMKVNPSLAIMPDMKEMPRSAIGLDYPINLGKLESICRS